MSQAKVNALKGPMRSAAASCTEHHRVDDAFDPPSTSVALTELIGFELGGFGLGVAASRAEE